MRVRCDGFTLTELLVVIGIVSVLAALLLPALEKSIDEARNVACKNAIRQIGLANECYLGDSGDCLPTVISNANWYTNALINDFRVADERQGFGLLYGLGYIQDHTLLWHAGSAPSTADFQSQWNGGSMYLRAGYVPGWSMSGTAMGTGWRHWPSSTAEINATPFRRQMYLRYRTSWIADMMSYAATVPHMHVGRFDGSVGGISDVVGQLMVRDALCTPGSWYTSNWMSQHSFWTHADAMQTVK